MKTRVDALRHEAGFTIIEVMVAIFILLLGVLATTTLLNTANAETSRNQARNGATNLVRDIIEASRALPYEQANPTVDANGAADNTLMNALQAMAPVGPSSTTSSFADQETTPGWQITRRNVTYTITLQACVVDDAKDNLAASHTPANADGSGYWCPNLPTPGATVDNNGDDYRRIKVTASWASNSCNSCSAPGTPAAARTYSVSQTSIIVNPSGGLGPSPIGPPTFTNPTDCKTVTINQQYPPDTVAVDFNIGDPNKTTSNQTVPTATDTTTGNKTFSYTYIGAANLPDNKYQVDIQGINRSGRPGRLSTIFLYVNCHEPPNVTGVVGGFDWRRCTNYPALCAPGSRIFDIDWNPSPDADVVGYYVYRVDNVPDYSVPAGDPELTAHPDTKVACVSRSLQPPSDTTTIPGSIDFLEPFQPACYDTNIPDALNLLPFPALGDLLNGQRGQYWIQAIDMQPPSPPNPSIAPTVVRTNPSNHSDPLDERENELNVRPTPPLTLSISNVSGQPCLSWTDSTDVTASGVSITTPVRYYRIYRDTGTVSTVTVVVHSGTSTDVSVQVPDVPYKDRIGRATPNAANSCDTANPTRSWFIDKTAPASAHYWVTAVDQKFLESFPSPSADWTGP